MVVMLPTLRDERVLLRPLEEGDVDPLAAVIASPGVVEWWGRPADPRSDLQLGGDAFAIEVDGALAGWLGFHEEQEPQYRHVGMDIFLAPRFHGAGFGRAALRLVARWLIDERGHHRITIDPARANERAIRAYASIGFQPVGVMRRYERGPDGEWRDGLLMDLLAEELQ